ncbi:ribonuclease P protein subunit p25-like protein isoform X2 [Anoplophora glabripennis]|nr:ribonuclease P protein subunit p25-like protein isoform X2 [Anoplophora glabripennis]XP_018562238.1 ribonuclease P protein subunit p25-like protein isoform X2 [Anoplophora glabripennis]
MENYRKGKNIEEPLERNKIAIPNLPDNFLWMQVKGGSKIRNLLSYALKEFTTVNSLVWTGSGTSVGKAITCAEIMKRECNNSLHQITKLCYRLVEEFWDPLNPELDQIVVKRKLPMIHIYLSKDPLNTEELGYQAPGVFIPYNPNENGSLNRRQNQNKKNTNTRRYMDSKKKRNTSGKDDPASSSSNTNVKSNR